MTRIRLVSILEKGFRQPNETDKLVRFGINKLYLGSKQEVYKNKHSFFYIKATKI